MTRDAQSAPRFDDFLQIGLVRPGTEPSEPVAETTSRSANSRRFWVALSMLAVCWMAWGAVLAHWLLLAEPDTPGSLHSVLLAMLAAAGGLVTIMALSATRAMDEARQSRPRPPIPAPVAASPTAPAPGKMRAALPPVRQRTPTAMPIVERPTNMPPPTPVIQMPQLIDEGEMMGRAYRLFSDGSIEIATLLGLRRFASLSDARHFIGAGDRAMTA